MGKAKLIADSLIHYDPGITVNMIIMDDSNQEGINALCIGIIMILKDFLSVTYFPSFH